MANDGSKRFLVDAGTVVLMLLALAGVIWTPYDPLAQQFRESALAGPGFQHWLGIDGLGRDFASRLWSGAGHTILLAGSAMVLTFALSSILVMMEQKAPSWGSRLIRMMVGVWVALPVIFLGLLLLVFLRPSPGALIIAVGLGNMAFAFRQLRVHWISIRSTLYVRSSEVLGATGWRLFRRAIWPNLKPDVLALGRLLFAMSALELSGLAFLGLIGDPDFPELGSIMQQNQAYLYQAPALVVLPGAILSLILLCVHLSRFDRFSY